MVTTPLMLRTHSFFFQPCTLHTKAQSHEMVRLGTPCRVYLKELRDAPSDLKTSFFVDGETETQRRARRVPIPSTLSPALGLKREPR